MQLAAKGLLHSVLLDGWEGFPSGCRRRLHVLSRHPASIPHCLTPTVRGKPMP